jgi:hypothetical protein
MINGVKAKAYKHKDLYSDAKRTKKNNKAFSREENNEKSKKREAELKKLAEYRPPEKQKLTPRPQDRLKFFSAWHFTVVLSGVIVLVLGLFALISISQARNQLGIDMTRLTRENERLKEINGRLKARIEQLVILEDLEAIAKETLNLQTPQKGQIFELE